MTIVVTGATGKLGRLTVEALLGNNVPAEHIVAGGRDLAKIDDFARRGVQVRRLDYDDPDSLDAAFAGADTVLLISGSEVGQRVRQHRNAIAAAAKAGVGLIAYTSLAGADTSTMKLAAEHQETEQLLRNSGVPFALLRNSWYLDNYTEQLGPFVERGTITGSAGDGRISAATRADYAAAAAAVVTKDDQAGKIYELGGDQAFTMTEFAEQASAATGLPVSYRDLPVDEYAAVLEGAGMPAAVAEIMADSDRGISRGDLFVAGDDLRTLIGRPATTMPDAVAASAGALENSKA